MLRAHDTLFGAGYASELMVVGLDGAIYTDEHWAAGAWPSLPTYRGGNFLVFDAAPQKDDMEKWDALYAAHFERSAALSHRTYGWSLARHGEGARRDFLDEGFTMEVTRVFAGSDMTFPPQANADVRIRPVESEEAWAAALDVQMNNYDAPTAGDLDFQRRLLARYRGMSEAGHGHWYGAFLGDEMVASCGAYRARDSPVRFQSVVTKRDHRRKGVASALVAIVAAKALADGAPEVIITAAAGSSPERIYRSLGLPMVDEMVTLLTHISAS